VAFKKVGETQQVNTGSNRKEGRGGRDGKRCPGTGRGHFGDTMKDTQGKPFLQKKRAQGEKGQEHQSRYDLEGQHPPERRGTMPPDEGMQRSQNTTRGRGEGE